MSTDQLHNASVFEVLDLP